MFKKIIANNYMTKVKKAAVEHVKSGRAEFTEIFEFVIDFSKKNKIIISDIDVLRNKHIYWKTIDLYAIDINAVAHTLMKELCMAFKQTFLLKVGELDKEYFIDYNLQRICHISAIESYKNYTLYDFINPLEHNNMYLMPPIIEIIYAYSILHNPLHADQWEDTLEEIAELEPYAKKDLEIFYEKGAPAAKKSAAKKSAAKKAEEYEIGETPEDPGAHCECKGKKNKMINIKNVIMEYISGSNYVLVSDMANLLQTSNSASIKKDGAFAEIKKIEVISQNSIDTDHAQLVEYLSKFISYEIIYKKKNMYLPKEYMMERHSFYLLMDGVKGAKVRKRILNVYNNASYELIHYKTVQNYKIADPIIQLRFIYIKLWTAILSSNLYHTHTQKLSEFVDAQLAMIEKLKKFVDVYERKTEYIGINVDPDINKKMMNLKSIAGKKNYYCYEEY
jgi:hypothetical protein